MADRHGHDLLSSMYDGFLLLVLFFSLPKSPHHGDHRCIIDGSPHPSLHASPHAIKHPSACHPITSTASSLPSRSSHSEVLWWLSLRLLFVLARTSIGFRM
uniref:Uncharacterized protein n=1 Tax=Craspedostauros australis TaxID=1486917 RepID=A0A7R9ZNA2_9STRA